MERNVMKSVFGYIKRSSTLRVIQYSQCCLDSTLDCEVGCSYSVVSGPRGRGSAQIDAAVLGAHVGDDQVPVSQHFGVVDVDGFAVGAAPGDDGPRVSCGHALQHHGLVEGDRDVLRCGDDSRPLTWFDGCTWESEGSFSVSEFSFLCEIYQLNSPS